MSNRSADGLTTAVIGLLQILLTPWAVAFVRSRLAENAWQHGPLVFTLYLFEGIGLVRFIGGVWMGGRK